MRIKPREVKMNNLERAIYISKLEREHSEQRTELLLIKEAQQRNQSELLNCSITILTNLVVLPILCGVES